MKTELFYDQDTKEELPLIVLSTFEGEGKKTFDLLKEMGNRDLILLCVCDLNWNDDLSPWYLDPVFKKEPPFQGKADLYLEELIDKILPETKRSIDKKISYTALAG